jgi:PAS domain S-box-containing protein
MDGVSRHSWFRSARSPSVLLLAMIVVLGVGGFVLTSTTIRADRDATAERRAGVEAVSAQEVLGRARAYVAGLADVLAREPQPGQPRFTRWASATSASVGLNDVLWVQRVPASQRSRYERLRGVPITRLTASGRLVRAPVARSYLPATFTSQTRPELRPGVDVTGFPALAAAIDDRSRIFAVGASKPGALGQDSGFYLLEAASFAGGRDDGYLAAFVPRGWFSTTLGGDPRRVAISEDGRRIEGQLGSVHASAGFEMLGRRWRIDVDREPSSGLQSLLPWLALAWPFAVAGIALAIGRATTLRRRAQREVERIFALSLDMISIIGFDGRFKAVNPAFERTLGYSRQEMVDRPFADFVHPEDLDASREAFTALLGGGEVTQFENRYVCANGSDRWLQWSFRALPEQAVVYGIARDVTERRRIDAELLEARQTAEAQGAELQVRAAEQAALRRVATLVAREAAQPEVFSAIASEIGQLLGTREIRMLRYEDGDTAIVVGTSGRTGVIPLGSRQELGDTATSRVRRTESTARIDDYDAATGPLAETARSLDVRSAVGAPIVVEGRLWGAIVAASIRDEPLPPETESRLGDFTELMATAIANTESRARADRLTDEQAALRRVATLVAEGASPGAVFDAVAAEMERVLGTDGVALCRYEPNDEIVVLADRGSDHVRLQPGTRLGHDGIEEIAGRPGVRASVDAPIVVDGRLWGVAVATWRGERSPPADTERRMTQFTELLDTAIANADSRDQLDASRARLVTEADEARRRVVRDLHDGAQQRLVHTIVTLKLAEQALGDGDGEAAWLVGEALEHAQRGNAELRELAHGILPAALTTGGLSAGVNAVAERLDLPVEVDVPAQRFPAEIERSAYFIVAESLTNIAKHADARHASVKAVVDDGVLRVEVRDDGIGGVDHDGHGLIGLRDRASALGGRLDVASPPGGGTVVDATLPLSH